MQIKKRENICSYRSDAVCEIALWLVNGMYMEFELAAFDIGDSSERGKNKIKGTRVQSAFRGI